MEEMQYHTHLTSITRMSPSVMMSQLAILIAALGGLLFGYDTGVIAGTLPIITQVFHLSVAQQALVVSSVVLGALIGATFSGSFVDYFGRRQMLLLSGIGFIFGTLLISFASEFLLIVGGRLIVGCAIGITSYTTPLFIAECSPTFMRGTLVLVNALTISGGEALAFLIDYLLTPNCAWRSMFAVGLIPALLFYIGMLYLPEPRVWTAHQSHRQSFKRNWKTLFSKEVRPTLWIAITLGVFQQFFGINTVMYYGPTLFYAIGYSDPRAQLLVTFLMGLINTLFSFICFYFVERLGRRKLLLWGSGLAGGSLFILAILIPAITNDTPLQLIAVICFVVYIAGYCISVGSLFWLIIAEIFPISVRGLGMSFAAAVQWGANFIVSMSFLSLIEWLGPSRMFSLYGLICSLCFLFCYYKIPETSKVALQDIDNGLLVIKNNFFSRLFG